MVTVPATGLLFESTTENLIEDATTFSLKLATMGPLKGVLVAPGTGDMPVTNGATVFTKLLPQITSKYWFVALNVWFGNMELPAYTKTPLLPL